MRSPAAPITRPGSPAADVASSRVSLDRVRQRDRPRLDRLVGRLIARLPKPAREDRSELAYSEALARRLAARRAGEALDTFESLPNIDSASVEDASRRFADWERAATESLSEIDAGLDDGRERLRRNQAEALGRAATEEELHELSELGILPESVSRRAAEIVAGS